MSVEIRTDTPSTYNPISALSCVTSKVATGEPQRKEKYQNRERSFCRQSLRYPGHSVPRRSLHELDCFTRNPSVSNVVTTLIGDNSFFIMPVLRKIIIIAFRKAYCILNLLKQHSNMLKSATCMYSPSVNLHEFIVTSSHSVSTA